jgi:signal transduction histidine kinase
VGKHAEAEHASVLLTRKNASIVIVIGDNLPGFDPSGTGGGSGIESMRERVELLDGIRRVESRAGSRTTLIAEVPSS